MALNWDALLKFLTPEINTTEGALDRTKRLGSMGLGAAKRFVNPLLSFGLDPTKFGERVAPAIAPLVGLEGILPGVRPTQPPPTGEVSPYTYSAPNAASAGPPTPDPLLAGIQRTGNTFTGVGTPTGLASDLGSPAHLARIAAADKALYDTRTRLSDEAGFASGRNLTRAATPEERQTELLNATLRGNRTAAAALGAQYGLQGDMAKTGVTANAAANKLALDQKELLVKGITAMADAGDKEAGALLKRMQAAEIAAGRGPNSSTFTVPQTVALYPGGAQPVLDKRTGKITLTTPKAPVTEENIQASMKERKMTREKTIELYRAQGFDVSGL